MSKWTLGQGARAGRAVMEGMESRRLLSAAVISAADAVGARIAGNVFNDLNGNGARDSGEPGLAGVPVWLTPLPMGSGPATMIETNSLGHYAFEGVPAGRYKVDEEIFGGWTQTKPIGSYELTVVDGQNVGDENFGQHKDEPTPPADTARINGRVFNDLNRNGQRDSGEPGLANVTVTLSQDESGKGAKTFVTGPSGEYSFMNLLAGSYFVTETVLSGYNVSVPIGNKYNVTLTAGQVAGDKIFAQYKKTEEPTRYRISGKVWNDSDNDGVFDSNESVSGVRTVYIDANNNGKLDSGERSVQSAANGEYVLAGLLPGTYRVSRVMPANFHLTNGTNGGPNVVVNLTNANRTGVHLGSSENRVTPPPAATATIGGVLFNDTDGDGRWDDNESRSGIRTVFIDTNGNRKLDAGERSTQSNAEGRYSFTGLTAGTYRITRVFPAGYRLSNNNDGFVTVSVSAGQIKANVHLGSVGIATAN